MSAEAKAPEAQGAPGESDEKTPDEHGAHPEYDESIVQTLASKILLDWLRNRQQLLVPLTLDLQKLEQAEVELIVHSMIAAAQGGGEFGEKTRERLDAALERLNASPAQRELLFGALERPKALWDVLANVREVRVGAIVYAVSLLAIDRRKLVNRLYLRYLAARLDIPEQLRRSLEQRFRAAV
ncbi:MAG: DUF533 domain-containing protein [Burkholderiales bacterium]